jgi:GR25 family glycosyltransferase involved in LPS biosynthesis
MILAVIAALVCLLVLLYFVIRPRESIDYYVITMKNPERMENIQKQQNKLNKLVQIVDAVVGKDLDLDALDNFRPLANHFSEVHSVMKREVGCYLSHMKVYDMIRAKGSPGYSVIFEDDFDIQPNFKEKFKKTLKELEGRDFDILMVGIYNGDGGDHVVGDVYEIPRDKNDVYGTHACVIKNKNIQKILDNLKTIEHLIDCSIYEKAKSGELTVYATIPTLVDFVSEIGSTIKND